MITRTLLECTTNIFEITPISVILKLKSVISWDVTPCSLLSCNRRSLLVLAEIISSTLKLAPICSSETSVATQQTTRRHIAEDDTRHNHRCEHLKSYIIFKLPKKCRQLLVAPWKCFVGSQDWTVGQPCLCVTGFMLSPIKGGYGALVLRHMI
jgi:hypothetical protein